MKKSELKKLSKEFSEFVADANEAKDIESLMSEFWSAKFGCNNSEREADLLEYWKNN